jgi:methionyl-tRNA synthetase
MINIEDFKKVEIKAGKILFAEIIEGSDKLLRLSVDFGEETPRQVVSGIRKYFDGPETLVGTTCAFITNLEPRAIMGLESQAMILAASGALAEDNSNRFFSLLKMDCPPGSLVR